MFVVLVVLVFVVVCDSVFLGWDIKFKCRCKRAGMEPVEEKRAAASVDDSATECPRPKLSSGAHTYFHTPARHIPIHADRVPTDTHPTNGAGLYL